MNSHITPFYNFPLSRISKLNLVILLFLEYAIFSFEPINIDVLNAILFLSNLGIILAFGDLILYIRNYTLH